MNSKRMFLYGFFLFVMAFGSVYAAPSRVKSSADIKPTVKKSASWLFVVSAGKAKIKKSKKGYVLKLKLTRISQVIMFADRPHRTVRLISGKELTKLWGIGSDSFALTSPNAVLSTQTSEPTIVILKRVKMKGDVISLEFRYSPVTGTPTQKLQPGSYKKVVLTIDSGTYAECVANLGVDPSIGEFLNCSDGKSQPPMSPCPAHETRDDGWCVEQTYT